MQHVFYRDKQNSITLTENSEVNQVYSTSIIQSHLQNIGKQTALEPENCQITIDGCELGFSALFSLRKELNVFLNYFYLGFKIQII